jgi:hypothetical protein
MHTLDTGRYIITNVRYGNVAFLPDAGKNTTVVAAVSQDDPGAKVYILPRGVMTSQLSWLPLVERCSAEQQDLHDQEPWESFLRKSRATSSGGQ